MCVGNQRDSQSIKKPAKGVRSYSEAPTNAARSALNVMEGISMFNEYWERRQLDRRNKDVDKFVNAIKTTRCVKCERIRIIPQDKRKRLHLCSVCMEERYGKSK